MKKSILLLFLISCYTGNAQWITLQPMPTTRQEMPSVVLNGKIYTTGGIATTAATLKTMEIYDPATNTWSSGPDMPVTLNHHAMTVLNGKIYVIGGYSSVLFDAQSAMYMFDPDSNKWYGVQAMPFASGAGDAVTYNGKIYYFGGKNGSTVWDINLEYDPAFDSWTSKSNIPTSREHLCAALSGNLIYVIAGRGTSGADTIVEVYHPDDNTWSSAAHLPTSRSGCDAAVYNGKIFVMGGEGGRVHYENEMYDPVTNSWTIMDTLPHARHGLGVVAIGDTLYAIGGATAPNFAPCNLNEAYIVPRNLSSPSIAKDDFTLNCFYTKKNLELRVIIQSSINANAHFTVYDMAGKRMDEWNRSLAKGYNNFGTDAANLAAGAYILKIDVDGKTISSRFLVGQ